MKFPWKQFCVHTGKSCAKLCTGHGNYVLGWACNTPPHPTSNNRESFLGPLQRPNTATTGGDQAPYIAFCSSQNPIGKAAYKRGGGTRWGPRPPSLFGWSWSPACSSGCAPQAACSPSPRLPWLVGSGGRQRVILVNHFKRQAPVAFHNFRVGIGVRANATSDWKKAAQKWIYQKKEVRFHAFGVHENKNIQKTLFSFFWGATGFWTGVEAITQDHFTQLLCPHASLIAITMFAVLGFEHLVINMYAGSIAIVSWEYWTKNAAFQAKNTSQQILKIATRKPQKKGHLPPRWLIPKLWKCWGWRWSTFKNGHVNWLQKKINVTERWGFRLPPSTHSKIRPPADFQRKSKNSRNDPGIIPKKINPPKRKCTAV